MTDSMADIIVQRDEWMQSAKQLDAEIAALKAKVTEQANYIIDRGPRCPVGHNYALTYDLTEMGGAHGCVACERDEATALVGTLVGALERFYTEANAIHGDDLCDERTVEMVRALLASPEVEKWRTHG